MNQHDIKGKLYDVMNYVSHVHFKDFEAEFLEQAYFAGGSIRSMMLDEDVKDYDIFLRSDKLVDKIRNSEGLAFVSNNAVCVYMNGMQIQIITNFTSEPIDMINEFDFTMNKNFYYPHKDEFVVIDEPAIMSKRLVINKTCRNKLGTLARTTKFVNRGYQIPSKTDMIMLGVDISKMSSVTSIEDLIEESRMYFSDNDVQDIRTWGTVSVPVDFDNGYEGSSV